MTAIQRLEWGLFNAGQEFKKAMCRSVAKYMQNMNFQYRHLRLIPMHAIGTRKRVILHAKTKALIVMDQEQVIAANTYSAVKAVARNEYQASQKPQVSQSAWFGGEYDERTYY